MATATGDVEYDLCVVGSGTSGLASARFYLDVHPDAKVIVLERDHTVGGVWSLGKCAQFA
jgi:dimethylaniline monooxygenase (N-oxide forming)